MPHPIHITDYDPAWPAQFKRLAAPLRSALGDLIIGVEHVGSTSVPGLAAKPVIDLDILISSRFKLPEVIKKLGSLSYPHEGDKGLPGREAFGWPGKQRHHLYVCSLDTPALQQHLLFRDYLRAFPEVAAAYGALKKDLAKTYKYDREAYTEGKTDFILRVIKEARASFHYPPNSSI